MFHIYIDNNNYYYSNVDLIGCLSIPSQVLLSAFNV